MCAEPWLIATKPAHPNLLDCIPPDYHYFVNEYPDRLELQIYGYQGACLCDSPHLKGDFETMLRKILKGTTELVYFRNDTRDSGLEVIRMTAKQALESFPPSMEGPLAEIHLVEEFTHATFTSRVGEAPSK